jgi:hypothetical protein
LAESNLTCRFFGSMLKRIAMLPRPTEICSAPHLSAGDVGRKGDVSAESIGKMIFLGVAWPPDAKPPLSGAVEHSGSKPG